MPFSQKVKLISRHGSSRSLLNLSSFLNFLHQWSIALASCHSFVQKLTLPRCDCLHHHPYALTPVSKSTKIAVTQKLFCPVLVYNDPYCVYLFAMVFQHTDLFSYLANLNWFILHIHKSHNNQSSITSNVRFTRKWFISLLNISIVWISLYGLSISCVVYALS